MKVSIIVFLIILIGIVGGQEIYAQQINWNFGDGLKQGDYFSYKLCQVDYKDCLEFQMNIWIQGVKKIANEEQWVAKTAVYDGNKVLTGELFLGKISPEPTGGSKELNPYFQAFKSSVTWLSAFSSEFNESKWGLGPKVVFHYNNTETVTIKSGTFDSHLIYWTFNNQTSKVWVVDGLPFPVKAKTFVYSSDGNGPIEYEFELLRYEENVFENPFQEIIFPKDEIEPEFGEYPSEGNVWMELTYSAALPPPWEVWKGSFHNNTPDFVRKLSSDLDLAKKFYEQFDIDLKDLVSSVKNAQLCEAIGCLYGTYHLLVPNDDSKKFQELEYGFMISKTIPPKKQLDLLVPFLDNKIICKPELELISKSTDSSLACVKPESIPKLIERGWAKLSNIQHNDYNDYKTWGIGENLHVGDYFSYNLCHVDYEGCSEITINLWFEEKVNEKWLVQVAVYDGDYILRGEFEYENYKILTNSKSEEVSQYLDVFSNSVLTMSRFATAKEGVGLAGPKSFEANSWGSYAKISGAQVSPTEIQNISVPAGTFESHLITFSPLNKINKIWIVDEIPFPVKAEVWSEVFELPIQEYKFELRHKAHTLKDPFAPLIHTDDILK